RGSSRSTSIFSVHSDRGERRRSPRYPHRLPAPVTWWIGLRRQSRRSKRGFGAPRRPLRCAPLNAATLWWRVLRARRATSRAAFLWLLAAARRSVAEAAGPVWRRAAGAAAALREEAPGARRSCAVAAAAGPLCDGHPPCLRPAVAGSDPIR